jgi:hypothetical protein
MKCLLQYLHVNIDRLSNMIHLFIFKDRCENILNSAYLGDNCTVHVSAIPLIIWHIQYWQFIFFAMISVFQSIIFCDFIEQRVGE